MPKTTDKRKEFINILQKTYNTLNKIQAAITDAKTDIEAAGDILKELVILTKEDIDKLIPSLDTSISSASPEPDPGSPDNKSTRSRKKKLDLNAVPETEPETEKDDNNAPSETETANDNVMSET